MADTKAGLIWGKIIKNNGKPIDIRYLAEYYDNKRR